MKNSNLPKKTYLTFNNHSIEFRAYPYSSNELLYMRNNPYSNIIDNRFSTLVDRLIDIENNIIYFCSSLEYSEIIELTEYISDELTIAL